MHTQRNRPLTRKLADEFPGSPLPSDQRRQQRVEGFAQALWMKNPRLSIDQVAKACSDQFRGHGIAKALLTRIRQEVRELKGLDRKPDVPAPVAAASPAPALPSPPKVIPPPPLVLPVKSTKEERKTFLESWALDNPTCTLDQAHAALKEKFGMSMGALDVAQVMRDARNLAAESTPPPPKKPEAESFSNGNGVPPDLRLVRSAVPAPPVESPPVEPAAEAPPQQTLSPIPSTAVLQAAVRMFIEHGIRKLEIFPDGRYYVEVEGKISP